MCRAMMAAFKTTLAFTMAALLMMTNQAALQRNQLMQKFPMIDRNVFGPCKNLEEYQRVVIRNRYYNNMNTINLVKRLNNPSLNGMSRNIVESKSKEVVIGMNYPDMPEKHLIMAHARPEMEAPPF